VARRNGGGGGESKGEQSEGWEKKSNERETIPLMQAVQRYGDGMVTLKKRKKTGGKGTDHAWPSGTDGQGKKKIEIKMEGPHRGTQKP